MNTFFDDIQPNEIILNSSECSEIDSNSIEFEFMVSIDPEEKKECESQVLYLLDVYRMLDGYNTKIETTDYEIYISSNYKFRRVRDLIEFLEYLYDIGEGKEIEDVHNHCSGLKQIVSFMFEDNKPSNIYDNEMFKVSYNARQMLSFTKTICDFKQNTKDVLVDYSKLEDFLINNKSIQYNIYSLNTYDTDDVCCQKYPSSLPWTLYRENYYVKKNSIVRYKKNRVSYVKPMFDFFNTADEQMGDFFIQFHSNKNCFGMTDSVMYFELYGKNLLDTLIENRIIKISPHDEKYFF